MLRVSTYRRKRPYSGPSGGLGIDSGATTVPVPGKATKKRLAEIRMETRGIATGISRSSTPSKKQFRFKVGVVGDHIQIPDLGSSLEIPCGALAHTTELAVSSPSKAPFIRPDVVVRSRLIEIQPHQEFQRTVTLKAQHDMAGLEKDKPENVQVLVHNPQTERWERIRTGRGHHGNRAADRNSEFPVHRGKWALIRDNSYEVMMSSCCTLCAVEYGVVLQAVLYGSLNQGRLELRLYLIHGVRDRMENLRIHEAQNGGAHIDETKCVFAPNQNAASGQLSLSPDMLYYWTIHGNDVPPKTMVYEDLVEEWNGVREEWLVSTWSLVRQTPLEHMSVHLTIRQPGSLTKEISATVDIGWIESQSAGAQQAGMVGIHQAALMD